MCTLLNYEYCTIYTTWLLHYLPLLSQISSSVILNLTCVPTIHTSLLSTPSFTSFRFSLSSSFVLSFNLPPVTPFLLVALIQHHVPPLSPLSVPFLTDPTFLPILSLPSFLYLCLPHRQGDKTSLIKGAVLIMICLNACWNDLDTAGACEKCF